MNLGSERGLLGIALFEANRQVIANAALKQSKFLRSLGTSQYGEICQTLLNEVAALVDAGRVRSTVTEVAGKIDAATLRAAHSKIESGSARGKIVLEGF